MKKRIIYMLSIAFFAWSCGEVVEGDSSTGWGIEFSSRGEADNAYGYISGQNAGVNQSFLVDSAYVREVRKNIYELTYKFTSSDSLKFIVSRKTQDFNFHFPKPDTVNQLLMTILNKDTLRLKESSVAIQPVFESNKFRTVANIHTAKVGTFNGTVEAVPLIRD